MPSVADAAPPPAGPAPATQPDLSTAAAACSAFAAALEQGDAARLNEVVVGDASERAWVLAQAAHLRALRELDAALAAHYDKAYREADAGQEIRDRIESARDDDLANDLKHATVGPARGDTVLLVLDDAASDDRQGRLVKTDARWRVDLASLSNYLSTDDTPKLMAIATAAESLARDVAGGKFASVEAAAQAIDDRLATAEEAPSKAAPATRPAAPGR